LKVTDLSAILEDDTAVAFGRTPNKEGKDR